MQASVCCGRPSSRSGSRTKERDSDAQISWSKCHCQIGMASSREAPNAASSSPSSRPPPHSLTTDVSGNIAQQIPKYASIIRNVRNKPDIQVTLNHGKPTGYPEPDTAAGAALILAGLGGALSHLGDRDGQAATKRRRQTHFCARGRLQSSQNELSALRCRPPGWTAIDSGCG